MKRVIFIASSLFLFAAFNYSIYQKEELKANGETVFLTLGTADPRSYMQGDYMTLRYRLEDEHVPATEAKSGYIVVTLDQNKIATFKRFHNNEPLEPGEKLVRYLNSHFGQVQIVPNSFMFQEGLGNLYARARYGVFKFANDGKGILVGLADDKFQIIQPD